MAKSDMDELNELAPDWIRVTRRSVPDPKNDALTVHEYHIFDEGAGRRQCVLAHRCHKRLYCLVAHTLSAVREFKFDLVSIPDHLMLDMSHCNGERTYMVALINAQTKECLIHVEGEDPVETVRSFWEHPRLLELALAVA